MTATNLEYNQNTDQH